MMFKKLLRKKLINNIDISKIVAVLFLSVGEVIVIGILQCGYGSVTV